MAEIFDPFKKAPEAGGIVDPFSAGYEAPTIGGELEKGVLTGIDATQQGLYGVAALAGKAAGLKGVEDFGVEGVQRNQREMEPNAPVVGRLEDIGGVRDAALWAAHGVGSLAPFAATSIATGGLGGVAGKALSGVAGKIGIEAAKHGALIGSTLNSVAQETGSIAADQLETGGLDPARALAYGIPAGLLDSAGEARIIRKLSGKASGAATKPGILRDIATQMGIEGATEVGQTGLERAGARKEVMSPEGISEMINAGALGALGGGIFGGAGRMVESMIPGPEAELPPEVPATAVTPTLALPAPAEKGLTRNNVPEPMGGEGFAGPISALQTAQTDAAQAHADAVYQARDDFEQAQGIRQELTQEDAQRAADRAYLTQTINEQVAAEELGAEERSAAIELARQGALPSRQAGLNPAAGPISAMAANAMDSGLTGIQTAQRAGPIAQIEAETQQANEQAAAKDAAKGAPAAAALPTSAPPPAAPPTAPAPFARVNKGTSEQPPAGGYRPAAKPTSLFPFATPEAAQKRAAALTQSAGEQHVTVPHPYQHDKYTVVPASGEAETMAQQAGAPIQRAEPEQAATDTAAATAAPTPERAALAQNNDLQQQYLEALTAGDDARADEIAAQIDAANSPKSRQKSAEIPPNATDAGAHEAASSPTNDKVETTAQILAGNQEKGHVKVGPFDISVENPEGSTRTDKANNPPKWSRTIAKAHYGYIKGTIGADKDHIDAFVKPGTESNHYGPVYVIDQHNEAGKFDEHKAMIGYASRDEAEAAYRANYPNDWQGMKAITETTTEAFNLWARSGETKRPFSETKAPPAETAGPVAETPIQERRKDLTRRQRVAEMSTEEMRRELLTSELTGLGNRRAYDESEKLPVQIMADADSLKWINDNMGHESGDAMLRAIGAAIAAETPNGYHLSGDEFAVQAKTQLEADAVMARVKDRLSQADITVALPDGGSRSIKGIGLSYGKGTTLAEADGALAQDKAAREKSGERASRGSSPPGATEVAAQRVENQVGNAPAQEEVAADTATEPEVAAKPAASGEFEKGDRVEITKGDHAGRHGSIERKDVMISRAYGILGPGMSREERSVYYTVKTDSGVSITSSPDELAAETSPAQNVVPDVEVDGRFSEPAHAHRMIAYYKSNADKARAAALRARKRESKADHMAQAKREDDKSEAYRAAFEAWAEKFPEQAKAIRGDKPIAAKPADAGGKFILTEAKHGKTGAKLWVAGMKDRVERDEYLRLNDVAKQHGGYYSKWTKGFEFTTEQQARDFMAAESGAAPATPVVEETKPAAVKAEDVASVSADDFDALINEVQAERAEKPAGLAKMQAAKAANEAARGPKKAIPTPQVPPIAGTAPLGAKAALSDAKKQALSAVKEGFAGLDILFGRKGTLGSGPSFDEETWAKAKPHFEAAFNDFVAAGKSLKEFVSHIIDVYNETVIPYLKRWHEEKSQGANDGTRTNAVPGEEDGARGDAGEGAVDVRGPVGERETGSGAERSGQTVLGDDGSGERGRNASSPVDGPGTGIRQEGGADRAGEAGGDRISAGDGAGVPAGAGSAVADYRPAPGDLDRVGSWRDAAKRNLDILELIHKLDAEKRQATPEEQALLAKFTGWGSSELRQKLFITRQDRETKRPVLDPENYRVDPAWKPLIERAAEIMTPEELATALASTQYAHYTSEPVVRSIWAVLERMGFKGGKILEPGMGTGVFHQLAPDSIVKDSSYTGIERESLTAAIARHLLPKQIVMMADYVKQKLPNSYFDIAIGNPPFAKTPILDDPAYSRYRFSLHDYFFAKTIDKVRPGGVMVFVTSRYTMDKAGDRARKHLAERADLIGAVRLPQTAFKANAGTEVVTDVLFLRKRAKDDIPGGQSWLELKEVEADGEKALVNEYFADHPEMVLGKHSTKGTMYARNSYTVLPAEGNIDELFQKAIENLPQNVYSEASATAGAERKTFERDLNPKVQKDGSLYVGDDGALYRREQGAGRRIEEVKNLSPKKVAWLKGFVKLRDLMKQARYDQLTDGEWEKSLQTLNRGYGAFVKEHGPINAFKEREKTDEDEDGNPIKRVYRVYNNGPLLGLDVEGPLVAALERIDSAGKIVKGTFLTGRSLRKPAAPEINSTHDALLVGLSDRGRLDLPYIAGLRGITVDEAIAELGDAIYRDPELGWQTRDEYLSGDVVKKLEEARVAAANDETYQRNVDALYKAQPSPLTARDVTVGIGSPWIPPSDIEQFADEMMGIGTEPNYNQTIGIWSVPGSTKRKVRNTASEWGTDRRSPYEILEAALNNKSIVIRDVDSDKKTYFNAVASAAANEKVRNVKEAFSRWIWTDAGRAERLIDDYNRRFNNIAPREFDGSFLRLPGLSMRWQESLHPHQKRAIWRQIQTGNTYLAHAVGAGKTMEMIIGAMEQRRLGLIQKPIFVVPNHMLEQFANEFIDAYPGADIMVAGDTNFVGDQRRRFVAQAAANNPDAIIITHSAFGKIAPPAEATKKVLNDLVDELRAAMDDLEADDRRTRSQMEARIEQLERRFGGRTSDEKADAVVTLDEMGVDHILVDEAHEFRKLDFVTNLNNVKGITPEGSRRALDLYIKVKALETINPGRSHTFASGTPVTNTLGELYSIMRFMDEDALSEMGLRAFDSWASQFGEVAAFDERNAAGKYEVVERFASFVNVPDLMSRIRRFMDALTSNQLSGLVKRPAIKGGEPQIVLSESSEALVGYMKSLEKRIDESREWKPSKEQPGNPDPLINIITDGRLAAIDLRFVTPAKMDPSSKLNKMLDEIIAIDKRIRDTVYADPVSGKADLIRGGGQIVFSALGFGEAVAANRGFDVRKFVTARLREGGIRPEQIAWMSDYKSHAQKEAMFRDMREGKIKVLFGSPKNMGTGLNVQRRLKALHYLAPPWYPADVEQPHGRILRQGNLNTEVEINWYATKGTYDSTQWQMIARKARFIEQAMTGDRTVRRLDDISEASQYEQASALASGDARVIQYTRLLRDIESLGNLERAHAQEQIDFRRRRDNYAFYINANTKRKAELDKAVAAGGGTYVYSATSKATIDGITYEKFGEIGTALLAAMKRLSETWTPTKKGETVSIGTIGNGAKSWPLSVTLEASQYKGAVTITARPTVTIGPVVKHGHPFVGDSEYSQQERVAVGDDVFTKVYDISSELRSVENKIASDQEEMAAVERRIGAPFERKQELVTKIAEAATLRAELVATGTQDPHADESAPTQQAVAEVVEAPKSDEPPKFDLGPLGSGMAREAVQAELAGIVSKWRSGPKVNVVQSVADLPFKAPAQARGAFWKDAVYLVADNLASAAAAKFVLLHEAAGHYGLSAILGDQLDPLMRSIYDSNAKVREMADQRIAHAARLGRAYSPALATEEALADLAGRGEVANIRGWKLLVAKIRTALRQIGFTLEMSDDDIGALLKRAREALEAPQTGAVDGQPRFSLADTPLVDGVEAVKDLLRNPRKFNWWHRTIGTQFHKAQAVPEFRPVFESAQRYLQDVSQLAIDAADKAPGWLPRLAKFADVFKFGPPSKDLAAVSRVVFEGTLNATRPDAVALRNLTHAQRKLYTQARAAIDLSLDQVAVSELYKLAGDEKIDGAQRAAKGLPPRAALDLLQTALTMQAEDLMAAGDADEAGRKGKLIDQMEKVVEKLDKLKGEGYAPLMRFGQYTVDATHVEMSQDGKPVVVRDFFGMYESNHEAKKAERAMRAEFPDSTVTTGTMDDEGFKLYRGLSLDSLALFSEATGMKENPLFQDYYKLAVSARSALTRMIHRKGIAGYNEDLQRVLASFITSNARMASRHFHFGEMTQAAIHIPIRMGDVRAEAAKLVDYVQNPTEEASGLRGLLFVNFLGGSVASALTNATQPVLMTLPYLSQFKGAAAAGKALLAASKVATGGVSSDLALRAAMTTAGKEGITEPQELHQLYAESIRGLGSSMAVRRGLRVWGSMFSLAESFNRRITFAAAFQLAQGMTPAELRKAGVDSPFAFAEKAVEDTQGIYNRGNRPNWARGAIGATVFTFKQYSIAYLEFLKRLPPKEKAIALSLLVLAAGLQGLPGADDLEDLIDTIGQMLGYNTNSKQAIREAAIDTLGKELGGLLMHGASGLPGSPVDVQQRLGLSNIVPGTGLFLRSSPDKAREIAEVVGPIGGVYTQAASAAGSALAGQWGRVVAAATPVAVQNVLKGVDMAESGVYKDSRGRKVVDVTAADAAFKALGVQPKTVGDAQRVASDVQQSISMARIVEADIADKWARAIMEKNSAGVQKAVAELLAWNQNNPDWKIKITPAQIKARVQAALLSRDVRLLKSAPAEVRQSVFTTLSGGYQQ